MKKINKSILLLITTLVVIGGFMSCKKDDHLMG